MDYEISNVNNPVNAELANHYFHPRLAGPGANPIEESAPLKPAAAPEEKQYEIKAVTVPDELRVHPEELVIQENVVQDLFYMIAHVPAPDKDPGRAGSHGTVPPTKEDKDNGIDILS